MHPGGHCSLGESGRGERVDGLRRPYVVGGVAGPLAMRATAGGRKEAGVGDVDGVVARVVPSSKRLVLGVIDSSQGVGVGAEEGGKEDGREDESSAEAAGQSHRCSSGPSQR